MSSQTQTALPSVDHFSKKHVGRLTLVGYLAQNIVKAYCSCGFPSVLMCEDDWLKEKVLGCPICHVREVESRERQAEYLARQEKARQREAKQEKANRDLYVRPHFETLTAKQRKWFKELSQLASFNPRTLTGVFHMNSEEVWDRVLVPLIEANCLMELVGWQGEARPYTSHEPYTTRVSPESNFKVRSAALLQSDIVEKRESEAQAANAAYEAEAPQREAKARQVAADFALSELQDFITQRCTVDPAKSESDIVLRSRYSAWASENRRAILRNEEFQEALDRAGFTSDAGRRPGLRVKKASELGA